MSAPAPRILIVDDSDLARDIATDALTQRGYVVAQASGIEEVAERHPGEAHVILMDVQLAEVFGDDLASVLKDVHGVQAPIYLYSNLPPDILSERASEAGLAGYVSKSDGIESLLSTVERALQFLRREPDEG